MRLWRSKGLLVLFCFVLLTGCWDQRQFKDLKLVLITAFDKTDDELLRATVAIPTVARGTEGSSKELSEVASATGRTPRETRSNINQEISKTFDASKLEVILVGKELVEQDLYPILDVFYRDPKSNLNSKLAMIDGEAGDVLSLQVDNEPRINSYVNGLLKGMIKSTYAPKENIQLICAELLEPGQDFGLPVMTVNYEENLLDYKGLGLFNENKYSGVDLDVEQTLMLLLMNNKKGVDATMTKKVTDRHEDKLKNYLSVNVIDADSKTKIDATSPEDIKVKITTDLTAKVIEFPEDNLDNVEKVKRLSKEYSEILTEDGQEILKIIQEANCDYFGIGRQIKAYHPEIWKQMKWKDVYPNIELSVEFNVKMNQHGIIN
ncbi:hypothetical protein N781_04505 [Pontibacillus halophilus JSM 076056 = DSM 19796]|uniref:Spore germination protein n=1 Tax=Pontibacillus halophilus JSM 076056 = DSM 19796 TaxID=1385510 RepID=A0A0A5GJL3_9BACI|nr:Ger(x)C family spore germination protein [Pontibacillus halophilus]KGX91403.1 hypothetical protein N781_04505 [Pontibacillus halophilus JSM 076056 = DSM 19796]